MGRPAVRRATGHRKYIEYVMGRFGVAYVTGLNVNTVVQNGRIFPMSTMSLLLDEIIYATQYTRA